MTKLTIFIFDVMIILWILLEFNNFRGMKNEKKVLGLMSCLLVIISMGFTAKAYAAYQTNYIDFSFTIKPKQKNSYTETRYRQTTDRDRAWFTQLTSSGEGWMTYTRFWLEKSNGENVSKAYNVQAGGAKSFNSAYSSASKQRVRLTAENNNYNNASYPCYGKWDEETAYIISGRQLLHRP